MAFENRTVEDVYELIIDGLQRELNVTFRLLPKAFVRVLAKVMAGVYITLYKQEAWIFLQMFVDTATFDEVEVLGRRIRPLVLWGELVGVGSPGEPTQFTGTITVTTVNSREYVDEGTQLKNNATGKIYITTESKLLANPTEQIRIKCVEAGSAGNLSVGDELQFVNNIGSVDRKAILTDAGYLGTDSETEVSYRERVRSRWRTQPQGGSLADYRMWASEVPGVYQTYIYKDDETSAGVIIYVSGDGAVYPDRIPSSELCRQVGERCTFDADGIARKPIGAVLDPDADGTFHNVKPVVVKSFSVAVTGYSGESLQDFSQSAKTQIKSYLEEREPYVRGLSIDNDKKNRISDFNVSSILTEICEEYSSYFEGLTLTSGGSEVSAYTLGRGELAKLDKLYINGVEV